MKISFLRCCTALFIAGGSLAPHSRLAASEPAIPGGIELLGDGLEFQERSIRLVNLQDPVGQPQDSPFQPLDSPFQPLDGLGQEDDLGQLAFDQQLEAARLEIESSPTADVIGQAEARNNPALDLGSLLRDSESVQTVAAQRRSQVAFDPHVRGYRFGQIYAQGNGEYFLPARLDLDSMLNKIDPSLISTVTVVPGPYGLRYGPGFSFIDIQTVDTPRSCCGFEWTNRFGVTARGNGGQIDGRDTFTGAGENHGFITHFGMRSGSDYRAGNGQLIPSSYNSQNALLQLGYDLSDYSKIEFRYSRLELRDTEYALQFFDIDDLATDSYNVNYREEDPGTGEISVAQVWYNYTRFNGDNQNGSKLEQRSRIAGGLNDEFQTGEFSPSGIDATVNGNLASFGARASRIYGEEQGEHLRSGVDFRYVTQRTFESFQIEDVGGFLEPDERRFSTNQPHSSLTDPGIFAEYTLPWSSYVKTSLGGRVDFAHTHARQSEFDDTPILDEITDVGLPQNDILYAGYLSGEVELTPEWMLRGGVGYAERTPDLINRYSDGVFLGILQNGFSKVAGFPGLLKEKALQADGSVVADYGYWSGRASAFHSWIYDYNTYAAYAFDPPTQAQILFAQNTDLATLKGFELYLDYELTEMTTAFGSMLYVEGYDHVIDRPLPGIYPLEGRLGLRLAEPSPDNIWGLEWAFRFVARQDRAGFLRDTAFGDTTSIQVEEETPGFFTSDVRGYYNLTSNLHIIAGVDNLFDRNYIEHLDLRLDGDAVTPGGVTAAFSPGLTAYAGLEWRL
ncbi:MAG: TonB-dependent receptor [Pirellulaceae bacterium]